MTEFRRDRPVADLEAQVASEVKTLLGSVAVGAESTVAPSSSLCSSLELYVPQVLRRTHSEWSGESLDGVFVARARKVGDATIELAGTCVLISDQTVTPILVVLALSPSGDRIGSVRVSLGEPGGGRLGISGPACDSPKAGRLLATVVPRLASIPWSYDVASPEKLVE
jgi:hypothetical protein